MACSDTGTRFPFSHSASQAPVWRAQAALFSQTFVAPHSADVSVR
jgi:hypothetical protein